MHPVFVARSKAAQPIWFVTPATFPKIVAKLDKRARAFVKAAGFEPRPGRHLMLPSARGVARAVRPRSGKDGHNAFLPGLLPGVLPAGTYRFANAPHDARLAALAFALGAYRFTRYRKSQGQGGAAGAARRRRRRRSLPHRRGHDARPRPDQHAGQRHGPGRAGGRRPRARQAARREIPLHRRRRPAEAELSADPRRRPRRRSERARRG